MQISAGLITSRRLQPLTSLERRAQRAAATGRVKNTRRQGSRLVAADHPCPATPSRSWAGVARLTEDPRCPWVAAQGLSSASSTESMSRPIHRWKRGSVCLCKESYQLARKSSTPGYMVVDGEAFHCPYATGLRWASGRKSGRTPGLFPDQSLDPAQGGPPYVLEPPPEANHPPYRYPGRGPRGSPNPS